MRTRWFKANTHKKAAPKGGFLITSNQTLQLRPSSLDRVAHFELLEVLNKQPGQCFSSFIVSSLVSPGITWVQQASLNARHAQRHVEVDGVEVFGFSTDQRAALDRCDHATSGRDVEALANAVAAAGPAGVDQVDLGAEAADAFDQQFCVFASWTREERCAEAGGESRLDAAAGTHFGRAHQCGVAGKEVVGRLFFAEDRDWRQNAGQVAGQEDHSVWLATEVFLGTLGNVLQRVGCTAVLGQADIGVVGVLGVIDNDVFQDSAVLDGFPDNRLVLLGEVDALGIATAFDVEHHAFAPTVLVVTDQVTAFVGGQGGFTGARQTEEQGHVARFTDVGSAVHWQHVGGWQQEVLYREHGFLHFTGVAHAGDQHFLLCEVEDHATIGVGAVTLRNAFKIGDVQHLPLITASRVVLFRVDEQATTEQVLPGSLRGHFHGQVVISRRTYMNVGNEMLLCVVERFYAVPQGIELVGRELAVDRAPSNGSRSGWLVNNETIDWRAAGTVTGTNNQRAGIGKLALTATQSFFYQIINTQIGVHGVIGLRHEIPRRPVAECAPNVL
ncbi:NAD-specific glutamate dehydrogenase [Pseudomonas sp. IT-P294]